MTIFTTLNESMSDKGDCRTTPATPGLLTNFVELNHLETVSTQSSLSHGPEIHLDL